MLGATGAQGLTWLWQQIAAFPLSGREVPEFGVPQIRQDLEGPFRRVAR
jgi:hypothetical protein